MKRADLIRSVQVQFKNMGERNAAAITDAVFDYLKDSVADGSRVELRGFGIFQPRAHMTKIGFNPKTGKRVAVPAGRSVKFRPSGRLVREMNE
ncbi:MAG: integration host factor subunit beta [Rickettsiales bacterium]|jgi:integration host factor subunit beta|nr:integration host factor subunit beta [Rickettsiales bacterium]